MTSSLSQRVVTRQESSQECCATVNQDTVQVFRQRGKRLSLPRHSTGLDFAFSIHTDIGLRARSLRINGVIRECGGAGLWRYCRSTDRR